MNPIQESKQELEASIRYAENAIVKANQTIESMATYQEQTGREAALQNQVGELKSECAVLAERIDEMKDAAFAEAKTIEHLKNVKQELENKVQGQYDDIVMLEREVEHYTQKYSELAQGMGVPTMPVIPKDVAIAIFREGTLFGVEAACDEIEGSSINIEESEYVHNFEVSFTKDIDLDDFIDFHWVRSKIGDYDEDNVTANLKGLCAKNNFECRIHGVDDKEEKKND